MSDTANLNADYEAAGFGGRLAFGKKAALLVIDVVEAYLDKASPLYAGVEDARDSNIRLVDAARAAGVPVVFTNVLYSAGGADGGVFYRKVPALKCFLGHGAFGKFPPGLVPREDELVISKQYPSAFFGTHLAATLRSMEVDTVVMGGFSTSGCVRASALGHPAARLHSLCGCAKPAATARPAPTRPTCSISRPRWAKWFPKRKPSP